MENNFKCPKCGKEYFIQSYSIKYIEGPPAKVEYYSKDKKVCCFEDSEVLISINRNHDFTINIGEFNSLKPLQKQEVLRKRARAHGKKLLKEKGYDT